MCDPVFSLSLLFTRFDTVVWYLLFHNKHHVLTRQLTLPSPAPIIAMFPLRSLRRAIIAVGWFALATSSGAVAAYDEEVVGGNDGVEDVPMTVIFVNEFPDLSIEVFWENHHAPEDDPSRRKFEGAVAPRGGRLVVETFLGHGQFDCFIPCF